MSCQKIKKKKTQRAGKCCKVTLKRNPATGKVEIIADKDCRLGDILEFKKKAKEFGESHYLNDVIVENEKEEKNSKEPGDLESLEETAEESSGDELIVGKDDCADCDEDDHEIVDAEFEE